MECEFSNGKLHQDHNYSKSLTYFSKHEGSLSGIFSLGLESLIEVQLHNRKIFLSSVYDFTKFKDNLYPELNHLQ